MYGNPETTTGGRALEVLCDDPDRDPPCGCRLRKAISYIGNVVSLKVVKNKVAPPYRSCKVDMIFGKGISSTNMSWLSWPSTMTSSRRSGSWFSYKGERIGQGIVSIYSWLNDNPTLHDEIEAKVKLALHPTTGTASEPSAPVEVTPDTSEEN
jgi:recombination protein RecA